MEANIDDFTREEICVYKGRRYYVLDNGSVEPKDAYMQLYGFGYQKACFSSADFTFETID